MMVAIAGAFSCVVYTEANTPHKAVGIYERMGKYGAISHRAN